MCHLYSWSRTGKLIVTIKIRFSHDSKRTAKKKSNGKKFESFFSRLSFLFYIISHFSYFFLSLHFFLFYFRFPVPVFLQPKVVQFHHWREGNLPPNSKCHYCRKSCWSAECLAGMRCEWCGWTVSLTLFPNSILSRHIIDLFWPFPFSLGSRNLL